jgi:Fur family ferric uptake transcriptional regulator
MICTDCGKTIEFFSEKLEAIQEAIASKHGFESTHHTLRMFGSCAECRRASLGKQKKEETAAEPRVRFASAPSTS